MAEDFVGDKDSDLVSYTSGFRWGLFCIPSNSDAPYGWTSPFVNSYGVPINGGLGTIASMLQYQESGWWAGTHYPLTISGYGVVTLKAPTVKKAVQIFPLRQPPNRGVSNFLASQGRYSALEKSSREWIDPSGRYLVTSYNRVEVNGSDKGKPALHTIFACLIDGNNTVFAVHLHEEDNRVRFSVRPVSGGPDVPWTFLNYFDWGGVEIGGVEFIPYPCPYGIFGHFYRNASGSSVVVWVESNTYVQGVETRGTEAALSGGHWRGHLEVDTQTGVCTASPAPMGTAQVQYTDSFTPTEVPYVSFSNSWDTQVRSTTTYDDYLGVYFDGDVKKFHTVTGSRSYTSSSTAQVEGTWAWGLMYPHGYWYITSSSSNKHVSMTCTETVVATIFGREITLSNFSASNTKDYTSTWEGSGDGVENSSESLSVSQVVRRLLYIPPHPNGPILYFEGELVSEPDAPWTSKARVMLDTSFGLEEVAPLFELGPPPSGSSWGITPPVIFAERDTVVSPARSVIYTASMEFNIGGYIRGIEDTFWPGVSSPKMYLISGGFGSEERSRTGCLLPISESATRYRVDAPTSAYMNERTVGNFTILSIPVPEIVLVNHGWNRLTWTYSIDGAFLTRCSHPDMLVKYGLSFSQGSTDVLKEISFRSAPPS